MKPSRWSATFVLLALTLGAPVLSTLVLSSSANAANAPVPSAPPLAVRPIVESDAALDTDAQDLAVLNRVTWGANTSAAQDMQRVGLQAYLEAQLAPSADDGLPPEIQAQIAAMEISRKPVAALVHEVAEERKKLAALRGKPAFDAAQKAFQQRMNGYAHEAATRSLLRDLYSRNQLKEQLTWFWFNHFNVSQNKGDIRVLVGDYEENAIRRHAMGKFRDLLVATVFHPAMMQYLDNAQNAVGHINENYAREIMELHTLGVGSGYTQADVQQLAHILTGLGVDLSGNPHIGRIRPPQQSAFDLLQFNPQRHDFGKKVFLGTTIKGSGMKELAEALAILCVEPPTAFFVSKKLATFFCCDSPPQEMVAAMAGTFHATDGDIAAVLRTMFATPAFKASLGQKFKDPVHYAVSALRASYDGAVIVNDQPLFNWLNRMAEPLYGHETPDGYPMTEAAWSGPGEMENRFEIARIIGLGHSGLFRMPDDKGPEPAPPLNIHKSHYYMAVAPTLAPATSAALAQAGSVGDWNMLFLSSPEFMHR